jgi:rod shape-determining protein MreD
MFFPEPVLHRKEVKDVPFLVLLLLLAGALILQTTVLDYVSVLGIKPDLVMLIVVLNGFLLGTREGAFLGYAAGILEDLFAGGFIGLNALSKMAAGYLAGMAGLRLFRENTLVATGVVFLSTFAGNSVYYILLNMVGIKVPPFYAFFRVIIPVAVYTSLLTPLFFRRIFRFVQLRDRDI